MENSTHVRATRRAILAAGALLAGLLAAGCATAESPAAAQRIVAIGDLHGDYESYIGLMREAGLIDGRARWTGGDTIFVQTGDVPDRGPDSRKIIEHLMKLEKEAPRKGGEVHALIGNHEAMNVTGDLRYVDPGEYAAFTTSKSKRLRDTYYKAHMDELAEFYRARTPEITDDGIRAAFDADVPLGYLEHRAAWSPSGEIGAWVASHDAVLHIGDTLFLHGGLSSAYSAMSIDEMNKGVRAGLKGEGDAAILADEAGPLWYRGNAEETEGGGGELTAVLAAFGAKRLVLGHTPQLEGIKALYGGRVVLIDTGISAHYGGTKSYLEIAGGVATAVDNGVKTALPSSGE